MSSQLLLCQKDALNRINSGVLKMSDLQSASAHCYSDLYRLGMLNDFQIRRMKFVQQTYDERILLWMVVAITLAGVVLAGLQLIGSYRLLASGQNQMGTDGEVTLERGRISLKSSVTGLLILGLSFAFFVVFVYEVFTIKEVRIDPQPAQQVSAGLLQPRDGAERPDTRPKK